MPVGKQQLFGYYLDEEGAKRIIELKAKSDGSLETTLNGSLANQFESVTVDNTVGGVALTSATYGTCKKAFITVETAPIRYRVDGGAPTATLGHLLNIGDLVELDTNEDITKFRAIRTDSASAVIQVTYSD